MGLCVFYGVGMEYASLGLVGFIGYMIGYAVSNLITLGRTGVLVEKMGLQALRLLVTISEDVEFVRAMKHRLTKDTGDTATAVRQQNMDDYEFKRWKKSTLESFLSAYPEVFRKRQAPFSDWEGAVRHLEKNKGKL
jgi:hypothetical protein